MAASGAPRLEERSVRQLVYALASLTAASRVRDRQHWLSDVVTGPPVGMASALVVRRWHDAHPRSRIDRALLAR